MRLLPAFLAVLCLTSVPAFANPQIGKAAPDFTATDIDGKAQSVSQYKGSVVVLEWTNPGCPFVKKHYETGNMQELQKYAADQKVVWLTVNSSAAGKQGNMTPAQAKESVATDKAVPAAYVLDADGKIGKLYGAKSTPHMFVIDKGGNLAYMGAIDDKPSFAKEDVKTANNYVRAAIDSLNKGQSVATATTDAYGCGVKY